MAVDIKDVEQVAQELQQKFDDFKAKNDKRVDAIEQEKGKLAGQVETLNGKLSELENLKSDLEKELLELKRPAGGAQNKLATEHKEAFVGFLRKGREDGLRDLERKALQVGTDEDGGYAVPEELDRNILNLLKDEVVMRQEATVITVGGSDYKKLVNLGGTASGWVGETDTRSQTATSRLELIEPLMGEIYGNPQATQKMLDDVFFNVEAWINSELATEFAEQEEIAFTSGDGTKKPKGFLAYESTDETDKVRAFGKLQHIVSGEATAVTADAIIKLIYTLRKAHRTGAKFMMNNNSLFAIRLLKDTEGNYLWRPGLELGQPSSLAGYGIAENEQMPDAATAQTLMSSCSALDDCISDSFSGFSIDGVADFVQNDVIGNASIMLGYVSDAMKVVDSAVSDAARLLQGDISVLLPPPSSGKNFVEQVQKMWRTGKRLYGNASDLVTMIKTLSGVSLGSDLQPRGVWKTDSKTTATATQQRNVVASTLRTTAISEAAYAVTRLPAPTTSAVMQNSAVGQATTPAQSTGWPSVTHPALNNAPAVKNTVDLPTWEELTDIRDTLNTAIDKELSRTTSDALFLALRRVKADLNADINTRLEQSARIIQRTPDEVLPALVLAATWFDNAARDADIIRRNAITHPGFVPVIPLKVPVQ